MSLLNKALAALFLSGSDAIKVGIIYRPATVTPQSAFITDPDVLVIGDLNSYAREDPITRLTTGGLTNLTGARLTDSYSYAFEGQLGDLDYALATTSLVTKVTGVTIWHINADEPPVLRSEWFFRLCVRYPRRRCSCPMWARWNALSNCTPWRRATPLWQTRAGLRMW